MSWASYVVGLYGANPHNLSRNLPRHFAYKKPKIKYFKIINLHTSSMTYYMYLAILYLYIIHLK